MTRAAPETADRLASRLAWLLSLGTSASCVLLAIGLAFMEAGAGWRSAGTHVVEIGVVLLVALPTLRVATMSVYFLFRRDFDFALIAALVLALIVVSTLLGAG